MQKKIGYVGLGKMGYNMVLHLLEKKYAVVATDTDPEAVEAARAAGARGAESLSELAALLESPRLVWLMVPHAAVDAVLGELLPLLSKGDVIVDGGNSKYTETLRRAADAAGRGVGYLDVGVSGGVSAARNGACMMIGGDRALFERYEYLFKDLALPDGYGYMGKSGAGHFVKMVHNGIEYGMMQAIGEGFEVLKQSPFPIDLPTAARVYNRGSIIESRLVGWLRDAFEAFGCELADVSGSIAHTGEGQWTIETAEKMRIPVPAIKASFDFRVASAERPSFTGKVVSALRNRFGGHSIKK